MVKKYIEDDNKEKSLFEIPSRVLVVGASGCGKTTLLYNNMIISYWIPYKNLYIFTKNIDQPVYKKLKKIFNEISSINIHFSYDDDIISVDDCESNSVVVIDDFLLENQKS
ncbi:Uncharacterized protein FWK35_00036910 [Aphis craccivora]|uniref:Uncharacterized protein n=1 Tax=Aphis craccivora TaxID=307492 RepID=A0A6G0VRB4_APHCR|nr:Uncharacterized protein FWK35_00036910 [Aphis craccivora]